MKPRLPCELLREEAAILYEFECLAELETGYEGPYEDEDLDPMDDDYDELKKGE